MNKEEIEKAKFNLYDDLKLAEKEDSVDIDVFTHDLRTILNHTEQLEKQVKELKKGQASLIQSRKKWKNRYYKESVKVKEQEESRQAVKDKLKEDIRIFQQKLEEANTKLDKLHYAKRIEYAREILNMLEGEKK